jgi:hypothetical protein
VSGLTHSSVKAWFLACLVSLATALAACGGEAQETRTVTVERQVIAKPSERPRPANNRRAPKPQPVTRAPYWVQCDPNIEALAETTTCPFAQNTFWTYWTSGRADSFDVWSPAARSDFATTCSSERGQVVCTTIDGGKVRFHEAAVDAYSREQADDYAANHDLGADPYEGLPQPEPGQSAPEPPPVYEDAPPAYDDDIPEEPATAPGENIPNYENGRGYRVQCEDGTYSQSGGIQGACSWHGGVAD